MPVRILLFLFVTLLGVFSQPDAVVARDKLTVGFFILPPEAMIAGGRPHGIAIDYFNEHIAPRMDLDVKLVALPFRRAVELLGQGDIDAVLLLGRNKERAKKFTYPAQPFDVLECGLVTAANGTLVNVNTIDDLINRKITITKDGFLCPSMRDSRLNVIPLVPGDDYIETLVRLAKFKRTDASYLPSLRSLRYVANKLGMLDAVRFIRLPDASQGSFTVFRRGISPEVVQQYDKANAQAIDEGAIEMMISRYMD